MQGVFAWLQNACILQASILSQSHVITGIATWIPTPLDSPRDSNRGFETCEERRGLAHVAEKGSVYLRNHDGAFFKESVPAEPIVDFEEWKVQCR